MYHLKCKPMDSLFTNNSFQQITKLEARDLVLVVVLVKVKTIILPLLIKYSVVSAQSIGFQTHPPKRAFQVILQPTLPKISIE
jgi:hypothetical protein